MRIESVRAEAFGPFRDESLEFAPGMTVIHGPNESGKSSWHSAIFAALCGIRRSRGRAPKDEQEFIDRHRPWRGRAWSVGALLALDDGRTIELEQNLTSGGASTAVDAKTKRRFTEVLQKEGCADVAVLFGLDRKVVLATLFVRQADILRVLTDARELQEYLERAAATSAVDTTADEAIERVEAYHKERVGLLRRDSRRPLQLATNGLDGARAAADALRDRRVEYNELLVSKYRDELDLNETLSKLRDVEAHERERKRRQEWIAIQEAERQLAQAHLLGEQIASGPGDDGAPRETLTVVTRALAAFEDRPSIPPELSGLSVEELEGQLATVPGLPEGDLEPTKEVTEAFEFWRSASSRMAAHEESKPPDAEATELVSPQELRRFADELDQPMPEVEDSLRAEIAQHREALGPMPVGSSAPPAAPTSRGRSSRSPGLIAGGVAAAVAGVTVAALVQPVVGVILVIIGIGLLVAGIRSKGAPIEGAAQRAPTSTDVAAWQVQQADLTKLEARLAFQQEAVDQARARYERAITRVEDAGLPDDPEELRRLAAEAEDLAAASRRSSSWKERYESIHSEVTAAVDRMGVALAARGISLDATSVEAAFRIYQDQCRERASIAHQAKRRGDLAAQLDARRAAELALAEDSASRERAEKQLLEAGKLVDYSSSSPAQELAEKLRAWLSKEESLVGPRQDVAKARARLEQILGGRTLGELTSEVEEMRLAFGDPPVTTDELADRSSEAEQLRRRIQVLRDQVAALGGQVITAERGLGDLSEALEAEARAERELERLRSLDQDLQQVIEFLTQAKEQVHADIAPVINQTLRPWVPLITNSRYDDVRVDPASLEIQVHEANGEFRSAQFLSHGTTEQLFLLLRLALAKHLATTGEAAPLILDDVTVQSDEERTVALLNLLHEISKERQVIFFTQEQEVLAWASEHLNSQRDRLIHLDRR